VTVHSTKVCVVGSVNIDTTYRVPALPAPGETTLASHTFIAPGGKGANQAMAATVLGSSTLFLGCVGRDRAGQLARESLVAAGIDVSQLSSVDDAPTGTAVLFVDDEGENVIVVDPGANQHLDRERVAGHLSTTTYDVVLLQLEINLPAVLSAARHKGAARLILNPAPMSASTDMLREVLQYTDVLIPNRQELARLVDGPVPGDAADLDRCIAQLDFRGAVVVTLGGAGVAVYEPGRRTAAVLIDPVVVDAVDTTGAGDMFCGAFGHFLARDGDVLTAARRANQLAALSTTIAGARVTPELVSAAGRRPASGALAPSSLPTHRT
jgi:ribokinase